MLDLTKNNNTMATDRERSVVFSHRQCQLTKCGAIA